MSHHQALLIIKEAQQGLKESIDLSNMELSDVPAEIRRMVWLKRINLSFNLIASVPKWIHELQHLEFIDFRGNKLKELCTEIVNLKSLNSLILRGNLFKSVPPQLERMVQLQFLSLTNNKIEILPEWLFKLPNVLIEDNPIVDPPIEIYSRGYEAVKNYFEERLSGTDKLFEAKLLIVGEPGAGKSTVMNMLLDEHYVPPVYNKTTEGIDIAKHIFKVNSETEFRMNVWDFGGQEIYHSTHQFFLTKRSLYLLVSDNRAENTDFNYWLQSVELLSGRSPIIILQNEKDNRKKDINISSIKDRFQNVISGISCNILHDKPHFNSLVSIIRSEIHRLPHIGTELPKIWIDIRSALENRSLQVPYITEGEYFSICENCGMSSKDRMHFLSDYLHDLGVFLHFREHAVLKRWIILLPEWATSAVYRVLDDVKTIESNGYFSKTDLKRIWASTEYCDMHDELIGLMMKFDLCYELNDDKGYIAPQLLKIAKPHYNWNSKKNIIFKLGYDFMPKGVLSRFIVRMNYYIDDQSLVWREGVVLKRRNASAELVETYGKKEISIQISGEEKSDFLAIIIDTFDQLHLSYSNIKVHKWIPCICNLCKDSTTPHYFSFEAIKRFVSGNIKNVHCEQSIMQVSPNQLLNGVLGDIKKDKSDKTKLYISYASQDEILWEKVRKHLVSLEHSRPIQIIHQGNCLPGENYKEFVRGMLDCVEVIIVLLSPNYISSEWHYYNELVRAMERSLNKTCLLLPVILVHCNWQSLAVADLKPITFRNNPILADDKIIDEAIADAVVQIQRAVDKFTT